MEKTLNVKSPSGRTRRSPLTVRNRLSLRDKDPNFVYRIVNDVEDRVELLQEQGYELVPDAKVGDKRVDNPSSLGSANSISVGRGVKAVVMRQRKEWYDEDQSVKQRQLDELEQTTKQNAKNNSDYGNIVIPGT